MNYSTKNLAIKSLGLFGIYKRTNQIPDEKTFINDYINIISTEKREYRIGRLKENLKVVYKAHCLAIESPEITQKLL